MVEPIRPASRTTKTLTDGDERSLRALILQRVIEMAAHEYTAFGARRAGND